MTDARHVDRATIVAVEARLDGHRHAGAVRGIWSGCDALGDHFGEPTIPRPLSHQMKRAASGLVFWLRPDI